MSEQPWHGHSQDEPEISSDLVRRLREQAAEGSLLPAEPPTANRPAHTPPAQPGQPDAARASQPALEPLDWTEDPHLPLDAEPRVRRTERGSTQRALALGIVGMLAYLLLLVPAAAALLPADRWARVETAMVDLQHVVTSLILLTFGYFFGSKAR